METTTTSNLLKTPASPDGVDVGQSATDLIGFYGATPVAKPASASQAAVTVTATTALGTATLSQIATSGKWGFASSTVGKAYVARMKQAQVDIVALGVLVDKLRADLVTLGLIKGAA